MKKTPDLCPVLQNPSEFMYLFTSQFKKKECPFPFGHIETFENGQIIQVPDQIPNIPSMQGKIRMLWETDFIDGLNVGTECVRITADIVDV